MIDNSQLAEILAGSDALTDEELHDAIDSAKKRGVSLYEAVVDQEVIDERSLIKVVGKALEVTPVWLGDRTPDIEVTDQVPRSMAIRNRVLPLKLDTSSSSTQLVLAMVDPLDILAMDEVASHTGHDVRPVLAGPYDLLSGLERVYGADLDTDADESIAKLEQAVSGEIELDDEDLDELGDDLADDSWADFFDEADEIDPTEDSAVISRDMQDRAISSVLDAVDDEGDDEDEDDSEDSLRSLDEPLSRSQITGGIQPDLDGWEVDGSLDGDFENKDYAKIGELFVYSPEKVVGQEKEAKRKKKDKSKKKDKNKKKDDSKKKDADDREKASEETRGTEEEPAGEEENSEVEDEDQELVVPEVPLGAAVISTARDSRKSEADAESDAIQHRSPDETIDEQAAMEHTSVTPPPIHFADAASKADDGEADEADEPADDEHARAGFGVAASSVEVDEELVEDSEAEDDGEGHTQFGFGMLSSGADDDSEELSEPDAEDSEADVSSDKPERDIRSTEKNPALVREKVVQMTAEADMNAHFVSRLVELGDLGDAGRRRLEQAAPAELIYAAILALVESDTISVVELVEFLCAQDQ
jgi:hypothetical protein